MITRTGLAMLLLGVASSVGAQSPFDGLTDADLADGERLFRIHCARCHGIDGAGGEGSNLARPRLKYATDDESLVDILGSGIPGTGMPAIWTLDEDQAVRVAGYVRTLGRLEHEELPGDPTRGAEAQARHRRGARRGRPDRPADPARGPVRLPAAVRGAVPHQEPHQHVPAPCAV